jgi:hypothetical protein
MFNLDIFNLPKQYTDLEKRLAAARNLGNCQGYITGHNGAEACWALAIEYKIGIKHFPDNTGIEVSYWKDGWIVREHLFTDFEHPELAIRYAVCELVCHKLENKQDDMYG